MDICLLIPTKDEGPQIMSVLDGAKRVIEDAGHKLCRIIIVDDSKDNTKEVARSTGAEILRGSGLGLGDAMFRGLKRAAQSDCHVIVTLDGDGQSEVQDIKDFIEEVSANRSDLVLASRFLHSDLIEYHYPFINSIGRKILTIYLKLVTGLNVTDSHGGIRAMRPEVAKSLEMLGRWTYVQETIIDAAEKGFQIQELPSRWKSPLRPSRVLNSIWKYIYLTLPVLIIRANWHMRYLLPFFTLMFFFGGGAMLYSAFFGKAYFSFLSSYVFIMINGLTIVGLVTLDFVQSAYKQVRS